MRYLSYIILLILISYSTFSKDSKVLNTVLKPHYTFDTAPLKINQRKVISKGEVIASSNVESFKKPNMNSKPIKMQKFDYYISGLHPKSCRFTLRKLSLYESYSKFLTFVEASSYDDKTSRVYFKISHSILPIDMVLYFFLPRIKKPGVYPFSFDQGFLKGLKGNIHVSEYGKKCFFFATAKWQGPHSGFADTLFEFFSKGMGIISMENLFRISGGNK